MKPIRVDTIAHLEEELLADSWHEDLQRYRTRNVFRGLSDSNYRLRTTLQRLGGSYEQVESFMLRNFQKYAYRDVVERDTIWHWLSIAQHHGLPTRLLDWTNSPLAALHFVTANVGRFDRDGAVWAVDLFKLYELMPLKLREILGTARACTVDELATAAGSFEKLKGLSEQDFMVFFEPPSIDERIVNQYAVFSVLSSATLEPERWLQEKPALCRKLVIPAKLKSDIRDMLDMANATERVFFPGLDGLCSWLKRYYGPSTRYSEGRSKVLFEGQHFHFYRGAYGWEYVHRSRDVKGVIVVATTKENKMILVEQPRVPMGKLVIELPGGLVDERGTDGKTAAVAAARRELEEETGFAAEEIEVLCEGPALPGLTDEVNVLCLARHLTRITSGAETVEDGNGVTRCTGPHGLAREGEQISVYEVPLGKIPGWLNEQRLKGKIVDLKVYAGLYFVARGLISDGWGKT